MLLFLLVALFASILGALIGVFRGYATVVPLFASICGALIGVFRRYSVGGDV